MENTFGVRLISSAGFSRIEVLRNSTFLDMKNDITRMVNVHAKDQKIFLDMANKKPLNLSDNTPVTKLGVK